jgi:hypothetical protein
MAGAVVTVDRLERGDLPPVCCKTGERTRLIVERKQRVIPPWTWVLLPFGVLPFVVVALLLTRRTVVVALPMSRRAARRLRTADRFGRLCLFFAVLTGLAAATGRSPLPWLVPVALFVATALAYARAHMLWVGVDLSYTTARLVHLTRVHPRFAEAVGYGPLAVRDLSVSRLAWRRPAVTDARGAPAPLAG